VTLGTSPAQSTRPASGPPERKTASGIFLHRGQTRVRRTLRKSPDSRRVAAPAATKSASGVRYYGQRYYNPSTGRWLSRDPLKERGGVNLYNFCGNNPVNSFDVNGLLCSHVNVKLLRGTFYVGPYDLHPSAVTLGQLVDLTLQLVDTTSSIMSVPNPAEGLNSVGTEMVDSAAGGTADPDEGYAEYVTRKLVGTGNKVGPWSAWTTLEFELTCTCPVDDDPQTISYINTPVNRQGTQDPVFLSRSEAIKRAQMVLQERYWASLHALER